MVILSFFSCDSALFRLGNTMTPVFFFVKWCSLRVYVCMLMLVSDGFELCVDVCLMYRKR